MNLSMVGNSCQASPTEPSNRPLSQMSLKKYLKAEDVLIERNGMFELEDGNVSNSFYIFLSFPLVFE